VHGAGFEEDIAFVEQEDGVPFCYHFEDGGEGGFDFGGFDAQVARAHHVQGYFHILCYGLGGEGLSDTWSSGQEHDDAFALAGNDVVEAVFVFHLGFGEGEDELFLIFGKDEVGEGGVVPGDFGNLVDEERQPALGLEGVALEQGGAADELVFEEGDLLRVCACVVG
jgi:hypothetical protein